MLAIVHGSEIETRDFDLVFGERRCSWFLSPGVLLCWKTSQVVVWSRYCKVSWICVPVIPPTSRRITVVVLRGAVTSLPVIPSLQQGCIAHSDTTTNLRINLAALSSPPTLLPLQLRKYVVSTSAFVGHTAVITVLPQLRQLGLHGESLQKLHNMHYPNYVCDKTKKCSL